MKDASQFQVGSKLVPSWFQDALVFLNYSDVNHLAALIVPAQKTFHLSRKRPTVYPMRFVQMPSAQIAHPNRFLQTSHFIVVYQRRDTLCRSISKICFHTPDGAGNNPEQSVHPFSAQQDLCPSALPR